MALLWCPADSHMRIGTQVDSMYLMMAEKKEDDEFMLQIMHSLYSLLMYDHTRDLLLNTTQVGPGRCTARGTSTILHRQLCRAAVQGLYVHVGLQCRDCSISLCQVQPRLLRRAAPL